MGAQEVGFHAQGSKIDLQRGSWTALGAKMAPGSENDAQSGPNGGPMGGQRVQNGGQTAPQIYEKSMI